MVRAVDLTPKPTHTPSSADDLKIINPDSEVEFNIDFEGDTKFLEAVSKNAKVALNLCGIGSLRR